MHQYQLIFQIFKKQLTYCEKTYYVVAYFVAFALLDIHIKKDERQAFMGLRDFFGCKVMGRERIFLFLILPPLLLLTAAVIFSLFRNETPQHHGEFGNPAPSFVSSKSKVMLEPDVLIDRLENAETLEKEGNFAKAAPLFQTITDTNPESDRAWGGLGRALLAMQKYREAEAALDRACRINVIEAKHLAARGAARRAMNSLKNAFWDFSDAQRLNPADIQISNTLLFVAIELGDYGLYDRTVEKIRQTSPDSQAKTIFGAAAREMRTGTSNDAGLLLKKASELFPQEQYRAFLSDRIFTDKRSKEFLATLDLGFSP